MQFTDRFTVEVAAAEAWQFVQDVPGLLACLPGCGEVVADDGGRYKTTMTERVGPFQVTFQVEADVTVVEDEQRIKAKGAGRDARLGSGMDFELELRVVPSEEGAELELDTDVQVRGPLAQIGFSMMQHKARDTFSNFGENVKAKLEGGAA